MLNLEMQEIRRFANLVMMDHPPINAVEVINSNGSGTVVYRDWP